MSDLRIWYAIPTNKEARAEDCLRRWKAKGYRAAVFLDPGSPGVPSADFTIQEPYKGYYVAANRLSLALLDQADIVVGGGDDMYPDPHRDAQQIGREFVDHFKGLLGVMQPVGDDLHPNVNTICGSPWMGSDFVRRVNQGVGPFWPEYQHFYGDQEMKEMAEMLGLLWLRGDLTHYHDHWSRPGAPPMTAHQKWQVDTFWDPDKAIFLRRQSQGFPGHELLP